ncbi:transmembrane protein 256 homolog isoform X2 [Saccostrea cucullata]|uniref:transmembrane protein 256 homolog isoform X2 n=1 Tax=Saccostrea cuccullata TaxID=36930 RepID=UPI002ED415D5
MDLWYILGYGKEALSAFDTLAKALGYQKADGKKEDMKELVKALRILLKPTFSLRIGGLSGIVAVSMAAYGAHVPDLQNNLQRRQIYEKGYKMQLLHSVALAHSENCRFPYVTCGLFTLGILLYSGSCYAHALSGNASYRYFTYAGEATLAAAWFSMLIS